MKPTKHKHYEQGLVVRNHVINNGADQPAHSRSLISAFAVSYLEGIAINLATFKKSHLTSLCS